jgi:hypothetical protein
MTARVLRAVAALGLLLSLVPIAAARADGSPASAGSPALEVRIDPAQLTVDVGQHIELTVTVTNRAAEATAPLAAHLDVTDPTSSGSVDPEDWTATLTKQIGVLEAGATRTIEWPMTPISGGRVVAYVLLIPTEGDQLLTTSNVVPIVVDEHRTLNPQGVLPIAAGAPLLVAFLLLVQRRWARRDD